MMIEQIPEGNRTFPVIEMVVLFFDKSVPVGVQGVLKKVCLGKIAGEILEVVTRCLEPRVGSSLLRGHGFVWIFSRVVFL